jgi:hypothetical protein
MAAQNFPRLRRNPKNFYKIFQLVMAIPMGQDAQGDLVNFSLISPKSR